MSNWRNKLCSTKDVKILETESDDEKTPKMNLDMYVKAHSYFKDKTALTEIRTDISGRFGYLEYFIHSKGDVPRDHPDDYCCRLIKHELYDDLMTIMLAISLERNKYASEWKCSNKIDITNFSNEIEIREWIISGRCKKCQEHAFVSKSLKEHQGCVLYDDFVCHNIQGKSPNVSYDLFYTYLTRISKKEQLEICNNRSCPCIPKNLSPENEFKININFDKEDSDNAEEEEEIEEKNNNIKKRSHKKTEPKDKPKHKSKDKSKNRSQKNIDKNDPCFCGSNKKYKNCCLNNKPPAKSLDQAIISNHMLKQADLVDPENETIKGFMNNDEGIYKLKL
jgi:hypothetical protein